MEELRRQLQLLRADNEQLQQQANATASTQASTSRSDTPPSNPGTGSRVTDHIVLFPRERWCSTFHSGSDEDVFEWIDGVKASLRARPLNLVEEALFILNHLGGSAKWEIRFRPREDPVKVFNILKELYGSS